jgi:hypothetical protein
MPPPPTKYTAESIPVLGLNNKRPSAATGRPPIQIQKVDEGAENIDPMMFFPQIQWHFFCENFIHKAVGNVE